jgi:hypothetical protein
MVPGLVFGQWMRSVRNRKRRGAPAPPQSEPAAGTPVVPLGDAAVTPKQAELTDILWEITHITRRVDGSP